MVRQMRDNRAAKAKQELAEVVNAESTKLKAALARASATAAEAIGAARDEVLERHNDLRAALGAAAGAAPGGDLDADVCALLAKADGALKDKAAAVEAVAGNAAQHVRKALGKDADALAAKFAEHAEGERARAEWELARQIVALEVRAPHTVCDMRCGGRAAAAAGRPCGARTVATHGGRGALACAGRCRWVADGHPPRTQRRRRFADPHSNPPATRLLRVYAAGHV
jgi:hypothetical protein